MYTDWTKHLKDPKAKAEFEQDVKNSKYILDHIKTILSDWEKSLDRSELDPVVFNLPNWAYSQAFKNGFRSCLAKLTQLIDLDQQITKDRPNA